ncbi:MAG: acyl-CoA dehydrogenase family protein [Chloroflexi bacterium]|nr:acyl-CoA dehydrogenase family protein [Chloroflexota bacterium]
MISFSMTEEQKMIVDAVSRFATREMREAARECDETGKIPQKLIDTAWEMGLVASHVPEKYDGFGDEHSALTGVLVAETLAYGDLSIALHAMAPGLLAFPILVGGTEEQKAEYLPLFCDVAFEPATAALIEPRYDFDPHELATTAVLEGDEYVLNGQKCYVPLAAGANRILVWAAEDGATQGFIVPRGAPGLEIGEREKNMGIKALATYELALNDCRVPAANKLGGAAGCDFGRILNYSRAALAAMAVGMANAAYEYAREYAKEREAFGEPIASRQAIAFMLAEMAIEVDATRLMAWEAAWKLDRGEDATKECYLAKSYADGMVLTVTDRAVQVLGGHGYIREHPVELWLRNGRGFTTFDGMATV